MNEVKKSKGSGGWLFGALFLATIVVSYYSPFENPRWNLIAVMVLMLLSLVFLGQYVLGRSLGILISERNLMSLARLQISIWTVIILSAYLVVALQRVSNGSLNPLYIRMDETLWMLLGISTASLVGSPLILNRKESKKPSTGELERTALKLKENVDDINKNSDGSLYRNTGMEDARFSDIFEGDEIGNTAHIDIAKVQMFVFTVVIAITYIGSLLRWVAVPEEWDVFPALSPEVVALLGISHAGYLSNKAVSHTKET